ncbi:MAG: NUDIX domain-containing protein [Candidatus Bathyarchaeia archaeon]
MGHKKRRRGTAIVEFPEGILVVSQNGRTFMLPGGAARKGESRRRAAIRELSEETGLTAIDILYLFEYTSSYNCHKVFLVKCYGRPQPRGEIKYITFYNKNSNIKVTNATKKIIEMYWKLKSDNIIYEELKCKTCGAPLKPTSSLELLKCEYCGTIYFKKLNNDL